MNLSPSIGTSGPARLAAIWIAATVVSLIGVTVAPLATFVLMISAFGLPHVLYELRYVDERFSARTPAIALWIIGALLAVIAGARIANGAHWLSSSAFVPLELSLGTVLALTAAWFMRTNRILGAALGIGLALGATFAPIPTFLVWAWLHNLTPLGFVAEITEGEERRRWLLLLSVPFFIVPAVVATGIFGEIGQLLVGREAWATTSAFDAGDRPLLSFLPQDSVDLNLFSAAVVAQSMHYVAVIVMLPQLLAAKRGDIAVRTIVPWPSWPVFAGAVAAIATVAFGIYTVSYTDARSAYSVAAAIHAWVEVPILLLAVGQGFTLARR